MEDQLVTWLILMCCPSFGFGLGSSVTSNFNEIKVMLDLELIIIVATGLLTKLRQIVALEGCTPRKVVLGSLPVTGLSCRTSELKVLMSDDLNPLAPWSVSESRVASSNGSCDSRMKRIWAIAWLSCS